MAKTYIADEIAKYLYTQINTRANLTGANVLISNNCTAIKGDRRPVQIKGTGVRNSLDATSGDENNILVFRGSEKPIPLDEGYQHRTYTTEIMLHWTNEAGLKLAVEEVEGVFNAWETAGGGVFQSSGSTFHKVADIDIDYRGKGNCSIFLLLKSRMEVRPQ